MFKRQIRNKPIIFLSRLPLKLKQVLIPVFMLVIVGVNQSSINVLDPDSHSTSIRGIYTWENSIGPKQFIRSDEFLRSSPSIIGAMTTGINNSSTLLSEESDVVFGIPNSGFDFFFFPEKIISFLFLPKISIDTAFSFEWWFPFVLLAISLYIFMSLLKLPTLAYFPILIILYFSPSSAWWSFIQIPILANFLLASSFLLKFVVNRISFNTLEGISTLFFSAYFTVRALTGYMPWSIVIGSCLIFASSALLIGKPKGVSVLTIYFLFTVTLIALWTIAHKISYTSLQNTIYPGQRRFTGGSLSWSDFFMGPYLWLNQFGIPLKNTNQSEISTGFIIFGFVVSILLIGKVFESHNVEQKISLRFFRLLLLPIISWLIWSTTDFGQFSSIMFGINRVSAQRVYGSLSVVVTLILFLILLPKHNSSVGSKFAIAIVSSLVTLLAGVRFASFAETTNSTLLILAMSVIISVIILMLVSNLTSMRVFALRLAACLTLFSSLLINPVNFGIDTVRGDEARLVTKFHAEQFNELRPYWVSDSIWTDALLLANGIKSLSSQQIVGPKLSGWQLIDPKNEFRSNWNRGASYVRFTFNSTDVFSIENPNPDIIRVDIDPCSENFKFLKADVVIASPNLDSKCLEKAEEFRYFTEVKAIYRYLGSK